MRSAQTKAEFPLDASTTVVWPAGQLVSVSLPRENRIMFHVPEGLPLTQRYLPCSFQKGGLMLERYTEARGLQSCFSASRRSAYREWEHRTV